MAKIDMDQLKSALENPTTSNIANLLQSSGEPGTMFGYTGTGIALTIFFSLIGFIYWRLGRKRSDTAQTLTGASLLIFPIFVSKTLHLAIIGALLCYLPYFLKKYD